MSPFLLWLCPGSSALEQMLAPHRSHLVGAPAAPSGLIRGTEGADAQNTSPRYSNGLS